MAKNRQDYSRSMQMVIVGITIFTCFTMSLLVWGWMDNIFFGNELSAYLSSRYYRFMVGFIMIPIFGGGAFMMYWATRSNTSFMDAMYDKLDLPYSAENEKTKTSPLQYKAKEYAENDPNFAQLLKRFYGYLRAVSGSGQFGVQQAVDLYSSGKSYMAYYFILGFAILPFLISYILTVTYIESIYQTEFNIVMKNARLARPDYTLVVILSIVIFLLFLAFKYVRTLTEKILGPVLSVGDKVLSTEEVDPWNRNFKLFMTLKHQYLRKPWRNYFYPLFFFMGGLPFIVGLVLLNYELISICGGAIVTGILLKRFDNRKGAWFQFKDVKNFHVGSGLKSHKLGIQDIDEVIVHYQSIKSQYPSIRLSSQSTIMRSLAGKVVNELFDSPDLIPSTITFFTHSNQAFTLPLRFIENNEDEAVSHEIEFYFAYWLKMNGFQFELADSDEDAGDWRAFRYAESE